MKRVENFEIYDLLLLLLVDFVNQMVCFAVLTRHFRFNLQMVFTLWIIIPFNLSRIEP